jgi:hypothetical protein
MSLVLRGEEKDLLLLLFFDLIWEREIFYFKKVSE